MIKKCKICNKEFKSKPSKNRIFCSKRCYGLWKSKNIVGKNHPKWKEKIEKNCLYCNKKFLTRESVIKQGRGKFCSKNCQSKWSSENIRGSNHHCWINGSSFEPYGSEFNERLKKQIRERDNYTCQECNFTENQLGYKLRIHHIDYNKKNSIPENLISLCKGCHMKSNFNRSDWTTYFRELVKV